MRQCVYNPTIPFRDQEIPVEKIHDDIACACLVFPTVPFPLEALLEGIFPPEEIAKIRKGLGIP